jgi:type IV pilus assembly protein PilC
MPKFTCEIQTAGGQITTQAISAGSLAEATGLARQGGGYLLNITEAAAMGPASLYTRLQEIRLEGGPGLKDVISFTKQLAVMIKAGISIRDAIESIAVSVPNMRFSKVLEEVRTDVESGTSFSEALAKHPTVFDPMYINMVRASELSGTFTHMLERIVQYLTQRSETRRMVIGAMIYPIVLFTFSIGAVVFLLTWVLPKFLVMFEGKEEVLPMATKMLMVVSDFMRYNGFALIGVLILLADGVMFALDTEKGKILFDRFKLKVPLFKKMLRALYITRSLQALGELINAGVPILDSLNITADISGNYLYHKMWQKVGDSVKEGNKLVRELSFKNLLPGSVVQMISAGEESGSLGEVLTDVSDYYAKELKDVIKAVTSLIEPVMIVFMGFIVGFIAMSIILPIFKMGSLVQ